MGKIAERVERGAQRLDQEKPGWWQDIEIDLLNMKSEDFCVLGQTYGSYWNGLRELDVSHYAGDSAENGFDTPHDAADDAGYQKLKKWWVKQIEQRRQAEAFVKSFVQKPKPTFTARQLIEELLALKDLDTPVIATSQDGWYLNLAEFDMSQVEEGGAAVLFTRDDFDSRQF